MISNQLKFTILKHSYIVFASFLLLFLLTNKVSAETVTSTNYEVQMGNLNMAAGMPQSETKKIGLTGGQNAPGLYSSTGYRVKAGFWYIFPQIPFRFSISDLSIDFGTLTPGTPNTLTNMLTVTSGSAHGYRVTASESAQLRTITGTGTIPDTTCNGGGNTCTVTTAKPWTDNTKYGFGFNMTGDDIASDFLDGTHFRPFAVTPGQTIMQRSSPGLNRSATVTYKVNIGASQPAGDYQNYIIFIATPTY